MVATAGLLLAAGAGRRMGRPKALVELAGEPLVVRALRALAEAGATPRVVVLGAGADEAAARVAQADPHAVVVVEPGWAEGMGASLRAGLDAVARTDADAVLVSLVDTPGIGAAALARVAAAAGGDGPVHGTVARGAVDGRPGHPVLIGRDHWADVRAVAHGDEGARGFLRGRPGVVLVEVADVADPDDVDTPEALAEQERRHGRRHEQVHRQQG